jgi:hypothetical protein
LLILSAIENARAAFQQAMARTRPPHHLTTHCIPERAMGARRTNREPAWRVNPYSSPRAPQPFRQRQRIATMSDLNLKTSAGKGVVMHTRSATPQSLVLDLLSRVEAVTMEEMAEQLPELNWSMLFQTIDALSRNGMVELRRKGFQYELRTRASALIETA